MARVPAAPVRQWLGSLEMTEREIARRCAERVSEIRQQAPDAQQVTDGIWTAEQAARFTLADILKEEIGEQADLWLEEGHAQSSMFADLLGAALSEVDWNEMAESYLSEE